MYGIDFDIVFILDGYKLLDLYGRILSTFVLRQIWLIVLISLKESPIKRSPITYGNLTCCKEIRNLKFLTQNKFVD